jgi:hypothetical protein
MAGPKVILYSREGCHLCDQAWQVLCGAGLSPTVVDIDTDPQLRQQYDTCIPVVEINGRVCFRGRVEPVLLARLLTAEGEDASN